MWSSLQRKVIWLQRCKTFDLFSIQFLDSGSWWVLQFNFSLLFLFFFLLYTYFLTRVQKHFDYFTFFCSVVIFGFYAFLSDFQSIFTVYGKCYSYSKLFLFYCYHHFHYHYYCCNNKTNSKKAKYIWYIQRLST